MRRPKAHVHQILSQKIYETKFSEEGRRFRNTRIRLILDTYVFIGDFIRLSEDELRRTTCMDEKSLECLKRYLAKYGLKLGLNNKVIDSWLRPRTSETLH